MMTLIRFGWRELWASKGRTALITVILAIQAMALGGGFFTFDSLFSTRDFYYEQLHLADLDVQFVATPQDELPTIEELRKVPGVRAVSRRFIAIGYIEKKDGTPLPVIVHHLDPQGHPAVNDLKMQSGTFLVPGKPEAAVIDRSFAQAYDLAIGDKIVVNPHRFAASYTVSGIALSPEFLVPTANPDMLVPNKGSIGIVYGSREQLDKLFTDKLYNNYLFSYEEGADAKETSKAVLAALSKLQVERVVPKKSNFGYRYIEEMLGAARIFMPATAAILAIMAAIVTFISVNRLVVSRRREIGGLLAQGYAPGQFVIGFAILGLGPGIMGGLLGAPGAVGLGIGLANKNSELAGLPDPIMRYTTANFSYAILSAVFVGLSAALLPALSVLKLRPAHALRGGDEIRFSGLPGPLERLLSGSVSARYALRNVFRRLRLSFATASLVALAIALPAGLLTATASWETWARSQSAQLHWDAVLGFKVAMKEDLVLKIMSTKGVGDYEGYVQGYGTLVREGVDPYEVRVRGLAVPSELQTLEMKGGAFFSGPDANEAIINTAFARSTPIPKIGDMVTVVYQGKSHPLKVVGLVSDLAISTMFAPLGTSQRIFGMEGKLSGAYLTFGTAKKPRVAFNETLPPEAPRPEFAERIVDDDDPSVAPPPAPGPAFGTDPKGMKNALLEHELVTSVQLKTEMATAMVEYFRGFDAVVHSFVALGGLLAFFFLLSVLGFLLLERETEYATLRTMGYGTKEIAKTVLTEVTALATVGITVSVGAWMLIAGLLEALLGYAWFYVPLDFRAIDFVIVATPTIGFLVLASLPGIRGLMRLQLATVLRGRSMG